MFELSYGGGTAEKTWDESVRYTWLGGDKKKKKKKKKIVSNIWCVERTIELPATGNEEEDGRVRYCREDMANGHNQVQRISVKSLEKTVIFSKFRDEYLTVKTTILT